MLKQEESRLVYKLIDLGYAKELGVSDDGAFFASDADYVDDDDYRYDDDDDDDDNDDDDDDDDDDNDGGGGVVRGDRLSCRGVAGD